MGYPTDLFPDAPISDEYVCKICHQVLQEPVVIDPCRHIFCKACIVEWAENSFKCPLDRHDTTGMKEAPRFFQNLLHALVVHCPFRTGGCQMPLSLGELGGHREECDFNPDNQQECTGGCGRVLKPAEADTHNCVTYLLEKLRVKETELQVKEIQLKARDAELEAKQLRIDTQGKELEAKDLELQAKELALKAKIKPTLFRHGN